MKHKTHLVFDGIPRNIPEAQIMQEILQANC